jgi:23S rRNA (uracil1939-C5)-methyltransferase
VNEDPSSLPQSGANRAETAQVTVDDLTAGPYGVARLDGKTVLVPNAAPGDRLEITAAREHRGYTIARLRRVVSGGPGRRAAPCPYLPACGGCDWQHLAYDEQIAAKSRLITREFERALGFTPAGNLVEPSPAEFGYRSRLRLQVGKRGELGFFELASNRLVAVERCLVAADDLQLAAARSVAQALAPNVEELEVVSAGERQVLVVYLRRPPDARATQRVREAIGSEQANAGVILRAGAQRVVLGEVQIRLELEPGLDLEVDADAFSQVNRQCNRKLIAAVVAAAGLAAGDAVLDLFCGAGNLSLPLARRGARVLGVDSDEIAIVAAARNAARYQLDSARFVAMKAVQLAPFLARAGYRPAIAVLDPPRTGARELMAALVRLRPRRVLYVSCDLATAVRDLRMLCGNGYALVGVSGFDFFPNTHHTEILAVAVLT